jgi:hypothetical protein
VDPAQLLHEQSGSTLGDLRRGKECQVLNLEFPACFHA